jgi:hypothetical protein
VSESGALAGEVARAITDDADTLREEFLSLIDAR